MLSKKYYVQFADMIAEHKSMYEHNEIPSLGLYNTCEIAAIDLLVNDMIALFKDDNPNFDVSRFNQYIDNQVKQLSHQ